MRLSSTLCPSASFLPWLRRLPLCSGMVGPCGGPGNSCLRLSIPATWSILSMRCRTALFSMLRPISSARRFSASSGGSPLPISAYCLPPLWPPLCRRSLRAVSGSRPLPPLPLTMVFGSPCLACLCDRLSVCSSGLFLSMPMPGPAGVSVRTLRMVPQVSWMWPFRDLPGVSPLARGGPPFPVSCPPGRLWPLRLLLVRLSLRTGSMPRACLVAPSVGIVETIGHLVECQALPAEVGTPPPLVPDQGPAFATHGLLEVPADLVLPSRGLLLPLGRAMALGTPLTSGLMVASTCRSTLSWPLPAMPSCLGRAPLLMLVRFRVFLRTTIVRRCMPLCVRPCTLGGTWLCILTPSLPSRRGRQFVWLVWLRLTLRLLTCGRSCGLFPGRVLRVASSLSFIGFEAMWSSRMPLTPLRPCMPGATMLLTLRPSLPLAFPWLSLPAGLMLFSSPPTAVTCGCRACFLPCRAPPFPLRLPLTLAKPCALWPLPLPLSPHRARAMALRAFALLFPRRGSLMTGLWEPRPGRPGAASFMVQFGSALRRPFSRAWRLRWWCGGATPSSCPIRMAALPQCRTCWYTSKQLGVVSPGGPLLLFQASGSPVWVLMRAWLGPGGPSLECACCALQRKMPS